MARSMIELKDVSLFRINREKLGRPVQRDNALEHYYVQ